MSRTQCQHAGAHSCSTRYRQPIYRGGTISLHYRDENGVWDVKVVMMGGTWSSTTETASLHHCGGPHWTTREALGGHHQAGHTKGPAPDCTSVFSLCCDCRLVLFTDEARMENSKRGHYWSPSNMATSDRSHWRLDLELSVLTVSGRRNFLILSVSYFQWTFPCWAGISISCCHRAYICHLLRPIFPLRHGYDEPHMFSYLYNLPKPRMDIC